MSLEERLAACWFSPLRRAIVLYLFEVAGPRTGPQILDEIEEQLGPYSEGVLKHVLRDLVESGILDSHKGQRGGYHLTREFRSYLSGLVQNRGKCV